MTKLQEARNKFCEADAWYVKECRSNNPNNRLTLICAAERRQAAYAAWIEAVREFNRGVR